MGNTEFSIKTAAEVISAVANFKSTEKSVAPVIIAFPQMWGSTTRGWGGIGGQAMTEAYTVVVRDEGKSAVYFGGNLAYIVEDTPEFLDHLSNRHVEGFESCESVYNVIRKGAKRGG